MTRQRLARGWMLLLASATASALCLSALGDWAGARYLRRYDSYVANLLASEHGQRGPRRRAILLGAPLEQNAAHWYKLSFAGLTSQTSDVRRQLKEAIDQEDNTNEIAALLDRHCRVADGQKVRDALRCRYCDWEISLHFLDTLEWRNDAEATGLAFCEILSGKLHAARGQRQDAANAYVRALAFGVDLDSGTYTMNVIALGTWQRTLPLFSALIDSARDDRALLETVEEQLSQLRYDIPTLKSGLAVERMWFASGLATEAHQYAAGRKVGFGHLVPWNAVAAWRVARQRVIERQLEEASRMGDARSRRRLAENIRDTAIKARSEVIAGSLIRTWASQGDRGDEIAQTYQLLLFSTRLHKWHCDHAQYPIDPTLIDPDFGTYQLQYQPIDSGRAYRLDVKPLG